MFNHLAERLSDEILLGQLELGCEVIQLILEEGIIRVNFFPTAEDQIGRIQLGTAPVDTEVIRTNIAHLVDRAILEELSLSEYYKLSTTNLSKYDNFRQLASEIEKDNNSVMPITLVRLLALING